MKKKILIATTILLASAIKGQETVSIGAGYTNQAYYQLSTGNTVVEPKNDWDIAFETAGSGWSILTNSANGVELWSASNDTTDFMTLDTAGMSSWSQLHNADTSWAHGAFAQNQFGLDLGWGTYSTVTHNVKGDEIFLLKQANGVYQKVWIKELASGIYTFRHATLDNSIDMTHSLSKSTYPNKNFVHFSLTNHTAIDKQPDGGDWDLYFGQFGAASIGYYNVSGVLLNYGVQAINVVGENQATFNDFSSYTFDNQMNVVGYDWKSYDFTAGWVLEDERLFFIKDQSGDIYKIYFTGFGGSSNGNFEFNKELISSVSVSENEISMFQVFPTPALNVVSIVYNISQNSEFSVVNMEGKVMLSGNLTSGFNKETIDVSSFANGMYLIQISNGTSISTEKIIVQK
jgi:hypothetical protein